VIVILTGAGISKESGLNTYRDADGTWTSVPIDEVAIRPATEQAGPVDDPPGSIDGVPGVQALTVVIVPFGVVARVVASGPIWPLPTTMPPAAFSRATEVASYGGTNDA